MRKNLAIWNTFKIFHCYSFNYFTTNKEIAITHLFNAIELHNIYHLVAKSKVQEEMCLNQTSKNGFGVIRHLLKVAKMALTHSILLQNQ